MIWGEEEGFPWRKRESRKTLVGKLDKWDQKQVSVKWHQMNIERGGENLLMRDFTVNGREGNGNKAGYAIIVSGNSLCSCIRIRLCTRQHQSSAGGQGQCDIWAGAVTQICSAFRSERLKMKSDYGPTDRQTDRPTDQHSDVQSCVHATKKFANS